MPTVRLAAPAKVNLFLEVLRRRPDGYHELSSLFQQVSLADELSFAARASDAPERETRLRCPGSRLPAGPDNLVLKAVRAFHREIPWKKAYDIALRKRVPVGAGLGGGSSDAAAAFKACWRLSGGGHFPWRRFVPAAKTVGADVPFFLRGGLAEAGGIGDRLTPLPARKRALAGARFVVIFPRVFVSTKWVYERLRFPLTKRRSNHKLKRLLRAGRPPAEWAPHLFNRLEEVVLPRVPAVRRAKRALTQAGCAAALMSGSGSAVFGVVGSEREAQAAIRRVRSSSWDVYLASPLGD
jgi:4-diphosphocytidyl-2-C-methyl-D-erythritol kinase